MCFYIFLGNERCQSFVFYLTLYIMIQDSIVIILVLAALSNIVYQVVKLIARKKSGNMACGGCSECELKKNIIPKNLHVSNLARN